jgi:ABC-type glycerol-3-phosphate transport system substrate-binding protein
MKFKWMTVVLVLMLVLSACASSQKPSTSQNGATQGTDSSGGSKEQSITVVARSGTYYNTLSTLAPKFEQETGIRVNVQEVGRDGYLQRVSTQLIGRGDGMDVVLLLNNYIGQFAAGGQLESLDSYMEQYNRSMDHFLPVAADAVKYNNQVYAMPLDVSTMFLVYRTDLIDTPPTTWEEYREVAKRFTQSINPDSPTEFGTTFQGKRGETQPKEWYQYFWAMGGELFDADLKPQLHSQSGIDALQYVVDNFSTLNIVPPDITTYEFPEVLSAFQNGKVAMAIEWNSAYPTFADPEKSPEVYDKFAIAEVPGGKSYMQTWTLAVNSASKNKDAAFQFISWVTNEAAKDYALAGGIPAVKSVLEDPEVVKVRPEFPKIVETLGKAQSEPNLPEWPLIHEFITDAITEALAGEKTTEAALEEADKNIANLLETRGYYN